MSQKIFDLKLSRFISLKSAKIRLRPFKEDDITPTYISWLNNPEVVRYSNQRFCKHTEENCRQYLAAFTGSSNHFLAIEDCASRFMLGTLTVYRSLHHRTADIGIMIGNPACWGKGIGFEAFRTISEGLERSGEIRKITAGTSAMNVGMIRIMEKAGLSLEATRRDQELIDGRSVDLLYYAKFCEA